jgi:hypothetical protein
MFAMVNMTSTSSAPKRTPWLQPSKITLLKLILARPCGYDPLRLSGQFRGWITLNDAIVSAKFTTLLATGIKAPLWGANALHVRGGQT